MDSNIKQQSESDSRHIEINHVRACPSAKVKADDEKKRGRLAQFSDAQLINQTTSCTGASSAAYILQLIRPRKH